MDRATDSDILIISQLRQEIMGGRHWYYALLEAIKAWNKPDETYDGRYYCYLIAGEAFDWLLLAERLCREIDGLVPEEEVVNLLFFSKPPLDLPVEEFKELIGEVKYRAYLNYLYGVVVEEALNMAVDEEVQKEKLAFVNYPEARVQREVCRHIYGMDMDTLLKCFLEEKGYPAKKDSATLGEWREFTYWLFHYRLSHCDKVKVASDTNKALEYLRRHRVMTQLLGEITADEITKVKHIDTKTQ